MARMGAAMKLAEKGQFRLVANFSFSLLVSVKVPYSPVSVNSHRISESFRNNIIRHYVYYTVRDDQRRLTFILIMPFLP